MRRMLAEMGSAELAEWMAYERLTGPLDGRRGDVQAAIIAATVANSQRTKGRALQPKDFLPKWDRPKAMTPEEMWAAAMQANAALGGTVNRSTS